MGSMNTTPKGRKLSKRYPNSLKQQIKQSGYTIREFAAEIDIPRSTLSDYLAGYRPMPHLYLQKAAQALGYEMHELLQRIALPLSPACGPETQRDYSC